MSATTSNAIAPIGSPAPPQSAFDQRLVEVDIKLPSGTLTFSNLSIYATGQKFMSAVSATCQIKLYNLTRAQRQQVITLSSPLVQPRVPIFVNLKVGRQSYGMFLLFSGQMVLADVLQPPDIGIVLNAIANSAQTGLIQNTQYPANTPLATIGAGVAQAGGWNLNNQCSNKSISNFSYTGSPLDGVTELNQMGGVQACVDNGTLIMINSTGSVNGQPYQLNQSTGMVGIPQVTDQGIIVRMMVNNQIQIGGRVTVKSVTNPAANGTYKILQIFYEIASRDQPFWYTLICSNIGVANGSQDNPFNGSGP